MIISTNFVAIIITVITIITITVINQGWLFRLSLLVELLYGLEILEPIMMISG